MADSLGLSAKQLVILALLIGGGMAFHLSLYSLALGGDATALSFQLPLLFGVFLMAISVSLFTVDLLSNPGSTKPVRFYVVYILSLSLVLSLTRLSRFAGLSGADAVKEAEIALGTYNANHWDASLGQLSNYQSSLAITILPSMIGRSIGLPANLVLLFQTFIMMALLPVVVQAVTSVLTGSPRLGALSGLLIATNWFFFGAHLIGKTEVALLLATLSVYCLMNKEERMRSLGVLLGLGVVMSHYTIGLYFSGILVIILIWSKILGPVFRHLPGFRKVIVPSFHISRPIIAIGLVVLWLAYAAPMVFPAFQSATVQGISGLLSNTGAKRADTGLVLSNTAVTFWFDFQNGLLVLGGLLAVNYYRNGRILGNLATWTVIGVILILLPLAWIILPALSVQVESTRIIGMILPFSILLVARLFMRVYSFPGNFWKAALLLIVLLLVPMNLMLLNTQQILYHQPGDLDLTKRLDLESSFFPLSSNHAMAYWADSYIPTNRNVEVDAISHYALSSGLPFPSKIKYYQEDYPPYASARFAVLTNYFVNYNIWTKSNLGNVTQVNQSSAPFFQFQGSGATQPPTRDLVYSSSRFWIVSPPHDSAT
jgi:hypothetical protein